MYGDRVLCPCGRIVAPVDGKMICDKCGLVYGRMTMGDPGTWSDGSYDGEGAAGDAPTEGGK